MHFPPLWDALFQLSWRQAWGFDWWSDVWHIHVCTHLTIKHTVIQHLLLEGMLSLFCSLLMGSDLSCYIKLLNDFSGTHTHMYTHRRNIQTTFSNRVFFFFLKEIFQIIINGPKKIKIFAFLNTWIGIFQVNKQLQNKLHFKQIQQNAIKFFHLLLIPITYLVNIRTFSI